MGRSEPDAGSEKVSATLRQASLAFEQGRLEDVLAICGRALEENPRCAEAQHYRAAAQLELGDLESAETSYRRALALAPEQLEILLGLAELLISHLGEDRARLEQGINLCTRGSKLAARQGDRELEFELLLLEGIGLNQLGACEPALGKLEEALRLCPDSVDAALERGIALFELCRFDLAERALEEVCAMVPDEPWAHHFLGLLAERRQDLKEAKKRFERARRLAPEQFPLPVRLSEQEFDAALRSALERLPAPVRKHLDNVTIAVEEIPGEEELLASRPPLSPSILGVFRGTPVGERSISSSSDHFPASIVLYQKNLERFARSRDELIEQIGITLIHEVGHLIGLDEEDLCERGLE